MKRVGFQFKVRKDRLAEYKEHHKQVWPEMLQALHEAGWHNYSLFARNDGLVFGYFETEGSLAGCGSEDPAQILTAAGPRSESERSEGKRGRVSIKRLYG